MWGKNEPPLAQPPKTWTAPASPIEEGKPASLAPSMRSEHPDPPQASVSGRALIGRSLVIKASISGAEDLDVDGELEGSVDLPNHNLTVGPNGKVSANVVARNITVHGTLRGNVHASEKVEIRKTGSLLGDLTTAGVTIEDGAYFKGSIDIVRPAPADKAGPVKAQAPVSPSMVAAG